MGYRWLKLWVDVLDDVKIHRLTDADFRLWITLLITACEEGRDGLITRTEDDLAFRNRRPIKQTKEGVGRLIKAGLIHRLSTGIMITNWLKRQQSPSKDRTARWRTKQRHGDGHGDDMGDGHGDGQKLRSTEVKKSPKEVDLIVGEDVACGILGDSTRNASPSTQPKPPQETTPQGWTQSHTTHRKPKACATLNCSRLPVIGHNGRWYCRECHTLINEDPHILSTIIAQPQDKQHEPAQLLADDDKFLR